MSAHFVRTRTFVPTDAQLYTRRSDLNGRCKGLNKIGLPCHSQANRTGYCPNHKAQVPPAQVPPC